MKGRKQSIFIGRKVPLVEKGIPILYQRYTKLSDLGIFEEKEVDKDKNLSPEQPSNLNEHNIVNEADQDQQAIEPNAVNKRKQEQDDEQEDIGKKKIKKMKKTETEQQQLKDSIDNDEVSGKVDKMTLKQLKKLAKQKKKADKLLKQQEQKQNNESQQEDINLSEQDKKDEQVEAKQQDKQSMSEGNLAQALSFRQVLGLKPGINKSAKTVKPFAFGFEAASQMTGQSVEGDAQKLGDGNQQVDRRVYVGGMPFSWSENDVREYWEYCGPIQDISLTQFEDTGRFKGIAFITFQTEQAYQAALQYDGYECEGGTLKIKPYEKQQKNNKMNNHQTNQVKGVKSKYTPQKVEGYNVAYVGNLAYDLSREQILEFFKSCGPKSVKLHTDKHTGEPKGFAHVFFENGQQLDRAIELNGKELGGRQIIVRYGQPKKN